MIIREKMKIASETKHLALVRDFIRKFVQVSKVKQEEYGKIILAVDEAVTNTIRHGYRGDPGGKIEIEVLITDNRFEVVLRDQGQPFSPVANVTEPDIAEHVARGIKGGLGLFLIRQVMDEINYCFREGNELRLVKYIHPLPLDPARSEGP